MSSSSRYSTIWIPPPRPASRRPPRSSRGCGVSGTHGGQQRSWATDPFAQRCCHPGAGRDCPRPSSVPHHLCCTSSENFTSNTVRWLAAFCVDAAAAALNWLHDRARASREDVGGGSGGYERMTMPMTEDASCVSPTQVHDRGAKGSCEEGPCTIREGHAARRLVGYFSLQRPPFAYHRQLYHQVYSQPLCAGHHRSDAHMRCMLAHSSSADDEWARDVAPKVCSAADLMRRIGEYDASEEVLLNCVFGSRDDLPPDDAALADPALLDDAIASTLRWRCHAFRVCTAHDWLPLLKPEPCTQVP